MMSSPQFLSTPFLSSILNTIADPLFVKDEEHRWIMLNDACCEFIGHPREALLGKSDYDFFPESEADVFWQKDELVLSSGQTNENEESFTDASGKAHIISTKKAVFQDENGRRILVGVIRDITDRKRMESELIAAREAALEAARSKASFLAMMSHEIRTPMNGVIGMTELLTKTSLTEDQRELAGVIRRSGEHLLSVITAILEFSKLEAGKVELARKELNFRDVVEQAVDLVAHRAVEKDLELACFIDRAIPSILIGDQGRLAEVLINLLANGLKFTDRGSVVVRAQLVDATDSIATVSFSVSDTGVGISPSDRIKLFGAFEQLDKSATRRHGGTGLGLAISRQLVELMGGRIAVESKVGEGSTFTFHAELGVAEGSEVDVQPDWTGKTAIIVDPWPAESEVLGEHLVQLGITPYWAPSIEAALEKIRARAEAGQGHALAIFDRALFLCATADVDEDLLDTLLAGTPALLITARGEKVDPPRKKLRRQASVRRPVFGSRLVRGIRTLLDGIEVLPTPVPSTRPAEHATERIGEGDGPRVLVVEDNPVSQQVAVRMLEALGYQADVVASGARAIEAANARPYAAILMDCQMPVMDGVRATREIRLGERSKRRTPIIGMTASPTPYPLGAVSGEMDDYLTKPMSLESLRTKLAAWVSGP